MSIFTKNSKFSSNSIATLFITSLLINETYCIKLRTNFLDQYDKGVANAIRESLESELESEYSWSNYRSAWYGLTQEPEGEDFDYDYNMEVNKLAEKEFLSTMDLTNPFVRYSGQMKDLLDFDYADQTEWLNNEKLVDKMETCEADFETNPASAVRCFQKYNPENQQEIFSVEIPSELQAQFNQTYCKNNQEDSKLVGKLENYIKEIIGNKDLRVEYGGATDLLKMDTNANGFNNMNHFYEPRVDADGKWVKVPNANDKWANAGPQPFHQDRSSLATSENGKSFLMLYTACSENLDDSKSGTWVSSAAEDFIQKERFDGAKLSYTEGWETLRLNADVVAEAMGLGIWAGRRDLNTYESFKFRAPRYTQGNNWTDLNYINEKQERRIKNLKRFQQIPSIAGNVLVFLEKNILHAGPEVLPKNRDVLNQMKRTVIRRRLYVQEEL